MGISKKELLEEISKLRVSVDSLDFVDYDYGPLGYCRQTRTPLKDKVIEIERKLTGLADALGYEFKEQPATEATFDVQKKERK